MYQLFHLKSCILGYKGLLSIFFVFYVFSNPVCSKYKIIEDNSPLIFHCPNNLHNSCKKLLKEGKVILKKLSNQYGFQFPRRIDVYICKSKKEMEKIIGHRNVEQWIAGMALLNKNLIIIRWRSPISGRDFNKETLTHEIVHIALSQYMGSNHIPIWLHEGVAQLLSGEGYIEREITMIKAAMWKRFFSIDELSKHFPSKFPMVELAYAESYYLVSFIINKCGENALKEIIRYMGLGLDLPSALKYTCGIKDMLGFEKDWESFLRKRFSYLPILISGGSLWFFISIWMIISYIYRKRKMKAMLKEWETQDSSDDKPLPE